MSSEWQVFLQARGGGSQFLEVPWSRFNFGRGLDTLTSASVTVDYSGMRQSQRQLLTSAKAYKHELQVTLDGVEAWVGPLLDPVWQTASTLDARDLSHWLERRKIHQDHTHTNVDLGTIYEDYFDDAMGPDTSPNITLQVHPTGVLGSRTVTAAERRRAADEMRQLAGNGLDYTVIGRTILAGGAEVPTPALPPITDEMVLDASANPSGLYAASLVDVVGASSSTPQVPIAASVGGVDAEMGLVERVFNEPSVLDNPSALAAARTRHDMLATAPLFVTGKFDVKRAPPLSRLVPGARAKLEQVSAGPFVIDETLRLAGLTINVDVQSGETWGFNLIPLGTLEAP